MIRSVKSFPLLDGARGRPKADLAALESVLLRLDALMGVSPTSRSWTSIPFMAGPTGDTSMAVDARLRVRR